MTQHIVFVEDDAELAGLISDFLNRNDFVVTVEPRGDTAIDTILADPPDLVLLDIMLPGKDGLTICRELRPVYSGPIVILTSLDSDLNQILGLEMGADDYILKTTPPPVLLARLRVQLRNPPSQQTNNQGQVPSGRLSFGQLLIDPVCREVVLNSERVILSTADFDLLWLLACHAGNTLDRDTLLLSLRGVSYDGLDRSIDVAISRLRKKLGDSTQEPYRIKTIRNKGYLFVPTGWQ